MAALSSTVHYTVVDSPVGELLVAATAHGLVRIAFQQGDEPFQPSEAWRPDGRFGDQAVAQLQEYFAGQRTSFDLARDPEGTDFQKAVWDHVAAIPYGTTASYGALAKELGLHNGARAVGQANAANPLPIVVPCHRVIASDGKLTGFSGGLRIKHHLLDLERRVRPPHEVQLGLF